METDLRGELKLQRGKRMLIVYTLPLSKGDFKRETQEIENNNPYPLTAKF